MPRWSKGWQQAQDLPPVRPPDTRIWPEKLADWLDRQHTLPGLACWLRTL